MGARPFFITYAWTANRGTPEYQANLDKWLRQTPDEVIAQGTSSMTVVGESEELRSWIGAELPLAVLPGDPPGLLDVTISTTKGDVVIRDLPRS